MNKEQAKLLWETDLQAGYHPAEAKERLAHFAQTGIALPDPTEKYWPALVNKESRGHQEAVSPKGATGIAQVMPATGPEAAALAGLEWDPVAFKKDPVYNAKLGRAYLRKQMKDNGNDPALALAAYNAGPGALKKAGGDISKLPAETQDYVPSIIHKADQGMQQDLDSPEAIAQAQEALMTPRDRARKVYEDILAKGGTAEDAKAAIAQFAAPKAAPTAQDTATAPPVAVPSTAQAPAEDPMMRKIPDPVARQQELLSGGMGDRFKAGFERSLGGADRGARKLLAQLTGQKEGVAKTESQEQAIRDVYSKMDPQGSGFSAADAGHITGDVAQAAVIGKAMPEGIAGGTMAGGVQGLLQPTTANDSQALNTGMGAATGGVGSAIGKALTATLGKLDPSRAAAAAKLRAQGVDIPAGQEYNSPVSSALRKMGGESGSGPVPEKSLTSALAKAMGMNGEDITNSSLEANISRSGKAIGDLSAGKTATPDRKFVKNLLDIGQKYQLSGPIKPSDDTMGMINHLLDRAKPGSRPITGEEYQALRTGLSANSITGSAADKQATSAMKRALDDMFNTQNPSPERAGLNSQYRLSQILRKGSGVPAEGMTAKQLRNRIESAASKGEVDTKVRDLLSQTNQLVPSVKVGGDAAAGAGDETVIRGLDRPGVVAGLMAITRGASGPASKFYDKGLIQKVINDPVARASLASLLRGGVIPQAAQIEQGAK